ncbi:MAG: thioredoxin family protein [Candidatus Aenigmarchaeota archaeon]|nr:thioredoxin family protein [Candidatus Aenigmarchaeota archaeon]
MYQIASTPSIVYNDEPIFIGKVPTKEELLSAINK